MVYVEPQAPLNGNGSELAPSELPKDQNWVRMPDHFFFSSVLVPSLDLGLGGEGVPCGGVRRHEGLNGCRGLRLGWMGCGCRQGDKDSREGCRQWEGHGGVGTQS